MDYIIVNTGAITTAAKLSKNLKKLGCNDVVMIRTPNEITASGCAYSIKIPENCIGILSMPQIKNRFKLRGIYKETLNGKERVYSDIS